MSSIKRGVLISGVNIQHIWIQQSNTEVSFEVATHTCTVTVVATHTCTVIYNVLQESDLSSLTTMQWLVELILPLDEKQRKVKNS